MAAKVGTIEDTVITGIAAEPLKRFWAVKRDPSGTIGTEVLATDDPTDLILGFIIERSGDENGDIPTGDVVSIATSGVLPASVKDGETIVPGDQISASTSAGQIQKLAATTGHARSGSSAGSVSGTGQVVHVDFNQGYYLVP